MARVTLDEKKLRGLINDWAAERAHAALEIYSLKRRAYDSPGYPFERHPGQISVRDPAAQSVTPTALGVRIAVEAEGAVFEEIGNKEGGGEIHGDPLAILLTAVGKVQFNAKGAFWNPESVPSYEGRRFLEKSVREAFGLSIKHII